MNASPACAHAEPRPSRHRSWSIVSARFSSLTPPSPLWSWRARCSHPIADPNSHPRSLSWNECLGSSTVPKPDSYFPAARTHACPLPSAHARSQSDSLDRSQTVHVVPATKLGGEQSPEAGLCQTGSPASRVGCIPTSGAEDAQPAKPIASNADTHDLVEQLTVSPGATVALDVARLNISVPLGTTVRLTTP